MNSQTQSLADELAKCLAARNPYDRFNSTILRRGAYWKAQRDIGLALVDPSVRRVQVKSGHMTGKDFTAAGLAMGWLTMNPDSGVVIVGPSLDQVRRSTWKEISKARSGSPLLRKAGRMTRTPMTLEYAEGWQMFAVAATEPERLQGFHPSGPVLVITGEASGVNDPDVNQALQSLKPVKRLDISNPLKDYGEFHEVCQRATEDPSIRVITIPSTDSPDIHLEHSPRGLADASWLRGMIADYGADSQIVKVRVKAEFPDGGDDLLILPSWLDRAVNAPLLIGGRLRMAIDLGLGHGGDKTVVLVRNDNGIVDFEASNRLSLEAAATRVSLMAQKYDIPGVRISYDSEGLGADFANRLGQVGLFDCQPYRTNTRSRDVRFDDLRTACHMHMRWRLDPERRVGGFALPPFRIPAEFMTHFRRECQQLTISTTSTGRTSLRDSAEIKAALRGSPDYSVTLAQSFAFPNT